MLLWAMILSVWLFLLLQTCGGSAEHPWSAAVTTMEQSVPVFLEGGLTRYCHVCSGQRVPDAVETFMHLLQEEFGEEIGFNAAETASHIISHICNNVLIDDSKRSAGCGSEDKPYPAFYKVRIEASGGDSFPYLLRRGYSAQNMAACACSHAHVRGSNQCSSQDLERFASHFSEIMSEHSISLEDIPSDLSLPEHLRVDAIDQFASSNAFTVLGLDSSGSDPVTSKPYDESDIKRAYRHLARLYHPDKNTEHRDQATDITAKINNACDSLLQKTKASDAATFTTHFQHYEFKFSSHSDGASFSFSFSF